MNDNYLDFMKKIKVYYMASRSFEEMEALPALSPFDDEVIAFLNDLSLAIRKDSVAKSNPILQTFAFFIRKSNLLQMKDSYDLTGRVGRGLSLHIAPSNVPINFAYSMVSALIAGNPCIVRASSKDFEETKIICRLLEDLASIHSKDIFKYISVISYSHDKEITDYLSSLVNIRIIWGGDNTISEIRKSPIRPRCTEVCFADRYSMLLVDAAYLLKKTESDKTYMEQTAKMFYNDTYLFDQNACGSPRLIYWLGDSADIEKAKEVFWKGIHTFIKDRYVIQPVIAVDKTTMSYRVSAEIKGSKVVLEEDNLITRVEISDFDNIPEGKSLADFEAPGGFFLEYSSVSLDFLKTIVDERYQTMTYICDESGDSKMSSVTLKNYIIDAGLKGIDRVVPIGHSADFGFVWDGNDLMYSYTRRIFSSIN